jgi:hypothetical protein
MADTSSDALEQASEGVPTDTASSGLFDVVSPELMALVIMHLSYDDALSLRLVRQTTHFHFRVINQNCNLFGTVHVYMRQKCWRRRLSKWV